MKITPRLAFTGLLVVLLITFNVLALELNYQARMFPLIIGVPVMLLAMAQLVMEVQKAREKGKKAEGASKKEKEKATEEPSAERTPQRVLLSSAWLVALLASVYVLGFIFTTFAYPFAYMKIVGKRSWRLAFVISLGAVAFVYLAMITGLNVDLYDGIVPTALRKSIYGY